MSEKAVVALKSGRLLTARDESVCGIRLEVGKVYAISGKVVSLRAQVDLCGLSEKWEDLSRRQRKGLLRMYRHGCTCGIKMCPYRLRCTRTADACNWTTYSLRKDRDCQLREGVCLRSASKQCTWVKNAALMSCMKNDTLTISRWSG